jgi:glyoxylase-like metal-dependent hydrolase (beta-lactamase superfamily II)
MKILCAFAAVLLMSFHAIGKADHLSRCWELQVKPLQLGYIHLNYTESDHELAHLFEPWQSYHSAGSGSVWYSCSEFLKSDTVLSWGRTSYSKTQLDTAKLLYMDYGDKELYKVTRKMFDEEPLNEARYSPALLINYFYTHPSLVSKGKSKNYAVYSTTVNKTQIRLFIRKSSNILDKVMTLKSHEQYGDVTDTIYYNDYLKTNGLTYPTVAFVSKVNNKVNDTVILKSVNWISSLTPLLTAPADYKMRDAGTEKVPELTEERYSDHIHFITLKHTNGRAMVVEFSNFLLVAESPLNSENGELIIKEAKKIAPSKPIKYFVFSHYHPDYTGGIRPFIHKGAVILTSAGDVPFIHYLATAPHTLQPDSLELEPRPLKTEEVGSHKTIIDGGYEMNIYFIGKKSEHTNDYLIYYFPQEKMVFEGDLVGISEKGPIRKAGKRQAGLYNAIKELQLDVTAVEQSWPVGYGQKTTIPFSDLEQAMSVK